MLIKTEIPNDLAHSLPDPLSKGHSVCRSSTTLEVHDVVLGLVETYPSRFRKVQIVHKETREYYGKHDTDSYPDSATHWVPTSAVLYPPRDCSRSTTHAVQSPLAGLQMLQEQRHA